MQNLTINTMISSEEADDFLAERGMDIEIPEDANPSGILRVLFDGFEDRLKAAGVEIGETTVFT